LRNSELGSRTALSGGRPTPSSSLRREASRSRREEANAAASPRRRVFALRCRCLLDFVVVKIHSDS
jgi:hypothetical protein